MGVSTNGIIACGVAFGEDQDFPWDDYDSIDDWWLEQTGFSPSFYPYDEDGMLRPGWTDDDPRIDEYRDQRRDWLKSHPLPVAVENYCSGDCPMMALVVPSSVLTCLRGYPETFSPERLQVSGADVEALTRFLRDCRLEPDNAPRWLLMSYWG